MCYMDWCYWIRKQIWLFGNSFDPIIPQKYNQHHVCQFCKKIEHKTKDAPQYTDPTTQGYQAVQSTGREALKES